MIHNRLLANLSRSVREIFPDFFASPKHNFNSDFGYPEDLEFGHFQAAYDRWPLATAAVDLHVSKAWETNPELWESAKPKESPLEAELRQHFSDIRLWQQFSEGDTRALVGGYGFLILRLGDNKNFDQPVGKVNGGIKALVEVVPVWRSQMTVKEYETDQMSPNYGKPKMYSFVEARVDNDQSGKPQRTIAVHPDRVIVCSRDGSLQSRSMLKPAYNVLLDIVKIVGAGGEGFWKNAKSGMKLTLDEGSRIDDMAAAMQVTVEELGDKMNETISDFNAGFDKMLMLQGMKAEATNVTLPSPEHFFGIALQCFAAAVKIPVKILVGNQTGERASTEDSKEFAKTASQRRENTLKPSIFELVRRLERFGMIKAHDWVIGWSDLTEASQLEKIERADKMASVNQKTPDEPAFTVDEIRVVAGFEATTGAAQ